MLAHDCICDWKMPLIEVYSLSSYLESAVERTEVLAAMSQKFKNIYVDAYCSVSHNPYTSASRYISVAQHGPRAICEIFFYSASGAIPPAIIVED